MARRYGQDDSDKPVPRNDVYTGMLAVSFFAMLAGCLLLFLDYMSYPEGKPPAVAKQPPLKGKAEPKPVEEAAPKKEAEPAKEEAKKEEVKKDEVKKEEIKKDEAKKNEDKKE